MLFVKQKDKRKGVLRFYDIVKKQNYENTKNIIYEFREIVIDKTGRKTNNILRYYYLIMPKYSRERGNMKTIVLANQKGGVAKTTTAFALACELGMMYRVLTIDGDPQGNLSYMALGNNIGKSLEDIFFKDAHIADVAERSTNNIFDCVPCTLSLSNADRRLTGSFDYLKIRKALSECTDKYDYCIIDSPPNLGVLCVNYLTSADEVVIPVDPCVFSVQGMAMIAELVKGIKENANPNINIIGVLLTKIVRGSKLFKASYDIVAQQSKKLLDTTVFETVIRHSVQVGASQLERKDIFNYARNKGVAEDYHKWVEELLRRINNGQ